MVTGDILHKNHSSRGYFRYCLLILGCIILLCTWRGVRVLGRVDVPRLPVPPSAPSAAPAPPPAAAAPPPSASEAPSSAAESPSVLLIGRSHLRHRGLEHARRFALPPLPLEDDVKVQPWGGLLIKSSFG